MSSDPLPEKFSFFDVPRALWHFLAEERWTFVLFSGVLLIVLCYTMVPPYIVGLITNFLIDYVKAGPTAQRDISPLLWLAGSLSISYAAIALIRLSSKRILGRISLNARYRAKVWGFERLLESALAWHQRESTGNKAQRVLTGADAVGEWTREVVVNFLATVATFTGSLIASLWLHPAFILFFVYYLGVLIGTELLFDRKVERLSDRINKSLENASGGFVESPQTFSRSKRWGRRTPWRAVSRNERKWRAGCPMSDCAWAIRNGCVFRSTMPSPGACIFSWSPIW